jgi:hypothetical protein
MSSPFFRLHVVPSPFGDWLALGIVSAENGGGGGELDVVREEEEGEEENVAETTEGTKDDEEHLSQKAGVRGRPEELDDGDGVRFLSFFLSFLGGNQPLPSPFLPSLR